MIISPYLKFRFLVGWHLEYNSLIFFLKRQCDLLHFGERLKKSPAYATYLAPIRPLISTLYQYLSFRILLLDKNYKSNFLIAWIQLTCATECSNHISKVSHKLEVILSGHRLKHALNDLEGFTLRGCEEPAASPYPESRAQHWDEGPTRPVP